MKKNYGESRQDRRASVIPHTIPLPDQQHILLTRAEAAKLLDITVESLLLIEAKYKYMIRYIKVGKKRMYRY